MTAAGAALLIGALPVWLGGAGTQAQAPPAPSAGRALVNKYCVVCHNARLKTAGLELDRLDPDNVGSGSDEWEKVVRKLSSGEMPPPRMPRPTPQATAAFVAHLKASLDEAAKLHPNPGRVPVHRLNRAEYADAVRDLLSVDIDPRAVFLADDIDQNGFDNDADVLSVSPALLEQYISVARKVSKMAIGEANPSPGFETYMLPPTLTQKSRMSNDLPFDSYGGLAIHHYFPADGDYEVKIRLRRQLYGYILGMGRPHQLEVRLNGKRIRTFSIGGEAPPNGSPASFAGNIMGDPKWDLYMHEADKKLDIRFPAHAGVNILGVAFVNEPAEAEGVVQPRGMGFGASVDEQYDGKPAVDSVLVGGPYDPRGPGETASRRRIFTCTPAASLPARACAQQILSSLARRAYRGVVSPHEMQTLLAFYDRGEREGGFEDGIRLALERLLSDPRFIFRVERDPPNAAPGTVYRLSDAEIASRLSFFLWSSIPDDELLNRAIAGELRRPEVLDYEVRRMLQDPRSAALVANFVNNWLELSKARSITPDPNIFPDFDENLRRAFLEETRLFVESQIRDDRGVMDLVSANYTYVNQRLARFYGIPNVYGDRFRRVTLNGDERGGLLGEGSILMATSYPNRTSPVLRGKWLLENILGTPPPPPPPNVPALKDAGAGGAPASVRARMEEHRRNPACAVCHVRMDPLGFALENFDAVGSWRMKSDGVPIDASGVLPDGTHFNGVQGLRALLETRSAAFAGTVTEKLMSYALGREIASYDQPSVRAITRAAAAHDYSWSAIISGIVKSPEFQMSIVKDAVSKNDRTTIARAGN